MTTPRTLHRVLINSQLQYGILPAAMGIPDGWETVGTDGTLEECKAWVDGRWEDMRPLSLRRTQPARDIEAPAGG